MKAILAVITLVIADQGLKRWAYNYLQHYGPVPFTSIFNLRYIENRGAAFGILYGARWFFVVITIAILMGMVWYYGTLPKDKPHNFVKIALVLIGGGAIGNFIDRLFLGFVIDFIQFTPINFPVFNLADVFIVSGAILFGALSLIIEE